MPAETMTDADGVLSAEWRVASGCTRHRTAPWHPQNSSLVTRHSSLVSCRRGQALLEMAVFGMVALAALGLLMRVGMQMNYDQEVRMAAFRRALAAAASDNDSDQDATAVAYHYILHRQMPNPSDGFMGMPRNRTESSAFVEWGDRLTFAYETADPDSDQGRKTQPLFIVRQDGSLSQFRHNDFPQSKDAGKAFRGFVTESTMTGVTTGALGQSQDGSFVETGTVTSDDTKLNTRASDNINSEVSSSATVSW